MENGRPTPTGVWLLAVLFSSPIWMIWMTWIAWLLVAVFGIRAIIALMAATVASAVIFGVVRSVNVLSTLRPRDATSIRFQADARPNDG